MIKKDKNLMSYIEALEICDEMKPILKKKYKTLFTEFAKLVQNNELDDIVT